MVCVVCVMIIFSLFCMEMVSIMEVYKGIGIIISFDKYVIIMIIIIIVWIIKRYEFFMVKIGYVIVIVVSFYGNDCFINKVYVVNFLNILKLYILLYFIKFFE